MKKKTFIIIGLLAISGACALLAWQRYYPKVVVAAIISVETPLYLPAKIQQKIERIKKPLNKGSEVVITEMHKANIPVSEAVQLVDDVTEDQALAMLDELNHTDIHNTDQVFDIVKKHVHVTFDIEIFRDAFNEHVDLNALRKILRYSRETENRTGIDVQTVKEILKNLLREKDKQLKSRSSGDVR